MKKNYASRQYLTRKVLRNMAKAQMKAEGIRKPCHQENMPTVTLFGRPQLGAKTSYFAANWREACKRHPLHPEKNPPKPRRRMRRATA